MQIKCIIWVDGFPFGPERLLSLPIYQMLTITITDVLNASCHCTSVTPGLYHFATISNYNEHLKHICVTLSVPAVTPFVHDCKFPWTHILTRSVSQMKMMWNALKLLIFSKHKDLFSNYISNRIYFNMDYHCQRPRHCQWIWKQRLDVPRNRNSSSHLQLRNPRCMYLRCVNKNVPRSRNNSWRPLLHIPKCYVKCKM